jgi:hypothetical protein
MVLRGRLGSIPTIGLVIELCEGTGELSVIYAFVLDAMLFCFLGASPLCGVGLSASIPQPPCGRLAGFPLQSLAQERPPIGSCGLSGGAGWRANEQ